MALTGWCASATLATAAPKPIDYCMLPLAISDRWQDAAGIPGYMGGSRKAPDWQNNGQFDHESFTDTNQNGVFDPGEAFIDANRNGTYDQELYDPIVTGYVVAPTPTNVISPSGDAGTALVLTPAASADDEQPGHYLSSQTGCGPGATYYERTTGGSVREITRLLQLLIEADPTAIWDPASQSVIHSSMPCTCRSPRIVDLPLYDPRTPLSRTHTFLYPSKLIPAFVQSVTQQGEVTIVFVPPTHPIADIHLARVAGYDTRKLQALQLGVHSWGALKATYR